MLKVYEKNQAKAKSIALASFFVIASLIAMPSYASHFVLYLNLDCPITKLDSTSGLHTLTNDGVTISGLAHESLNGSSAHHPLMSGPTPAGIPLNLEEGRYFRFGADYNSMTGVVSCHYHSSLGLPDFNVFYTLTNGTGGEIKYTTIGSIRIQFHFGLKKDIR